jgi:thiol peroxidase
MGERKGAVTFKGDPLTLVGDELKVGDKAPDVTLIANDMTEAKLSEYRGKVLILAAVPSLDTDVCDAEARRFNESAAQLSDDVAIVVASMDLPFAQQRWCGAAGVDAVRTLSDHRDASFGEAYGVLIKELRLLARTVFVVDREGTIRYIQLVNEMTDEPDHDEALGAARAAVDAGA